MNTFSFRSVDWLPALAAAVLAFAPHATFAHGGGHGGGGHGGGGHMGGGHMGGGSFHSGGMHMAPSHSFAPSRSFSPSHSISPSRTISPSLSRGITTGGLQLSPSHTITSPRINSPNISASSGATGSLNHSNIANHLNLPAGNSISGRAAGTLHLNTASGAVATHHGLNAASQASFQHVHSNLNHAINSANSPQHLHSGNFFNTSHLSSARSASLSSQATSIRHNWNLQTGNRCFHNNWWTGRSFIGFGGLGWYGGWGYSPWLGYYPWQYWWGRPSWNSCVSYLPGYGWNNGYYYNYGPGGNVVYNDGQVTVDGEVVGTDAEYAQSALALANVDSAEFKAVPPGDWLPLGTFSMAVNDNEVDPARVVQLAVSKTGLISGTIHNRTSGNTYTVQGRVDKDTQRLAFTIGDDRNTVIETGLYNLTQDQTPVLYHAGNSQSQVYMLVRLPQPEGAKSDTPASSNTSPATDTPPAPAPQPDAAPSTPPPTGIER